MGSGDWFERDLVGDTSAHEPKAWPLLAASVVKVLGSGRNRALAIALFASALVWGPYVLAAIPAVFTGLVIIALVGGGTRRAVARRTATLPVALPHPLSYSDKGAQALIGSLSRCRRAVQEAVAAGPQGTAFSLASVLRDVPQLERRVIVLAARLEYLAQFLSEPSSEPLKPTRHLAAKRQKVLEMAHKILDVLETLPAKIATIQFSRLEACDDGVALDLPCASAAIDSFESELLLASSDCSPAPSQ